jgi:gliding motility-associated-like protein
MNIWSSVTGGTPPYYYQWNNGNTSEEFDVNLTVNITYSLTVTDSRGCVAYSMPCEINIRPLLSGSLILDKDTVCPGDPVLIDVRNVSGGDGNYHYHVNGEEIFPPQTIYPEQTGIIQLIITDECNSPQLVIDTSVVVLESPDVAFIADKLSSCPPAEIHFSIPNYIQGYLYTWQFGDGKINISYSQSVSHTYKESGRYSVSVHVDPGNGCLSNSSLSQMITVYPKPVARFETNPEIIRGVYPEVRFYNLTENGDYYFWDFGDSTNSIEFEPVHKFNIVNDSYTVMLAADNIYGCKDTARKILEVKDFYTFWAPTAFSPDDDYVNDIFLCKASGIDYSSFYMKIYDRWGEIVFESNDIFKGWDGRIKGGSVGTPGVYTWVVSFRDNTGNAHTYSGELTLIR